MNRALCPGQDPRYWKPEDVFEISCGQCGGGVEFFKDEAARRCPRCGTRIRNPRIALGCAQWCAHAAACLGFDPKELSAKQAEEGALVDRLIGEMKRVFGDDPKRISHALAVLEHAQELLREERADPRVVLAAAVLHDIGIREAERKHGSPGGIYQQIEGPPIARPIMKNLGLDAETIDHVCRIIADHHSAKEMDTPEFRVLWDADWLVNLPDEFPGLDRERLRAKVDRIFRTEAGKRRACRLHVEGLGRGAGRS